MIIQLQNVNVLNNPAKFTTNFKFQITFDCVAPGVQEELEWKLVYVGCADNESKDQKLDEILVGPVRIGKNRFHFEAPPPDPTIIPKEDLLDVTVILLTCSYKGREFIRIGYYVHNEYEEDIDKLMENDDFVIDPNKIQRNILSDKPRVTRFNIPWDGEENTKEDAQHEDTKEDDDDLDDESYVEEEEEEDEEDEEDEEEDDDQPTEEDLVDTEQEDNNKANTNTNASNGNHEEDQDIDMID
eukprot:129892_1